MAANDQNVKMTDEEKQQRFREVLEDVVSVIENFSHVTTTPEELAGICKLALENDGQLKLLMSVIAGPPQHKK